jgi:hypothetical protein
MRVQVEEYEILATRNAETKPVTRDLLTYAAKAADLSGVDLVLTHQPENWKGPAEDLSGALSSSIQDTGRMKPVLVSANVTWMAGEPFRLKLPRTAGIGGVTAQLSGQGTRKPVPVAMAEAIVFEFVPPDGRQERVVRELFDFMGKARRATQKHPATEEVRNRTEGKNAVEVAANIYSMLVTTDRIDPSHLSAVALGQPPETDMPSGVRVALRRLNIALVTTSNGLFTRLTHPTGRRFVSTPTLPGCRLLTSRPSPGTGGWRLICDTTTSMPCCSGNQSRTTSFSLGSSGA